jgi:hypothetical protein
MVTGILTIVMLIAGVLFIMHAAKTEKDNSSDMWKREAVIAHVMATGQVCEPIPELEDYCGVCNKGPCIGPIQQFYKLWP